MFKRVKKVAKTIIARVNNFAAEHRTALTTAFTMGLTFAGVSAAMAFTSGGGTTTGFAEDIYDIAVNQIIKGPIGFVVGAGCLGLGGWAAVKQNIPMAICSALGGAAILKVDTLVDSLGMII